MSPNQVLLPGEPVSHSHSNAAAHLSTIVAAHALVRVSESLSDITPELDCTIVMVSLIGELSWNAGDGSASLRDAIEQHLQETPLAVESFARKSHWSEDWQLTHYEVLLSTGGPACVLRFAPDADEVALLHQDWGTPWRELPLDQDDIHALQWFAAVLGLDA